MVEGAMIAGGICLSYWVDFGMSFCSSSISWRLPIAIQIVFALVILAFVLQLPESPRWLILKVCPYALDYTCTLLLNDDGF